MGTDDLVHAVLSSDGPAAEASDELGLDVAEAVLATAQEAHLDGWTQTITHHPAAAELLSDLQRSEVKCGLLSNTHWPRSFHERFLERDGLGGLIDECVYTSEIDWIKPHPEPFQRLCDRLQVEPERALFVGDRPIDDIQGASAVGMRTIWIRNTYAPGDGLVADVVVDDLGEVWNALGDLVSS